MGAAESPGWLPFAATLVLVALAMIGMSIGVMLSGKRLAGSCGGIACKGACHECPDKKDDEGPGIDQGPAPHLTAPALNALQTPGKPT